MANPLAILFDNPIMVKHIRARLRPAQIAPMGIIVICLCMVLIWAGMTYDTISTGTTFLLLMAMAALTLSAAGGQQAASSVGGAKDSGILDFHRVSPLPPSWLTVGFFLGAPIREYVMFALTLPFALYAAVKGPLGLYGFFEFLIPLLLGAWFVHSLAMLTALVSKKSKSAAQGALIGLLMVMSVATLVFFSYMWISATSQTISQVEGEYGFAIPFFKWRLNWMQYLAINMGIPIIFFLIACTRKMKAERVHAYSKPLALLFMAAIVTVALGDFWTLHGRNLVVPCMLFLCMISGVILGGTVTPDFSEYQKGIRRALRVGRRRAPRWSDAASNQWAIYGLAALTAIGATVAWEAIEKTGPPVDVPVQQDYTNTQTMPINRGQPPIGKTVNINTVRTGPFTTSKITQTTEITHNNGIATITRTTKWDQSPLLASSRSLYAQTIAIGAFTVAYFGFGAQYFMLKFGRRGEMYFRLFLFFVWILPLLAGAAAGWANLENKAVSMILAISPLAGIVLSAMPPSDGADFTGEWPRFIALFVSISFAFIFHFMLTAQQRRIDRKLREGLAAKAKLAEEAVV